MEIYANWSRPFIWAGRISRLIRFSNFSVLFHQLIITMVTNALICNDSFLWEAQFLYITQQYISAWYIAMCYRISELCELVQFFNLSFFKEENNAGGQRRECPSCRHFIPAPTLFSQVLLMLKFCNKLHLPTLQIVKHTHLHLLS